MGLGQSATNLRLFKIGNLKKKLPSTGRKFYERLASRTLAVGVPNLLLVPIGSKVFRSIAKSVQVNFLRVSLLPTMKSDRSLTHSSAEKVIVALTVFHLGFLKSAHLSWLQFDICLLISALFQSIGSQRIPNQFKKRSRTDLINYHPTSLFYKV